MLTRTWCWSLDACGLCNVRSMLVVVSLLISVPVVVAYTEKLRLHVLDGRKSLEGELEWQ